MKKRIIVLDSDTIKGQQVLEFFKIYSKKYKISGLTSSSNVKNIDIFLKQVKEFNPKSICVKDSDVSLKVQKEFQDTIIVSGLKSLSKFLKILDADIVVSALSGINSVKPILSAISVFKDIALCDVDPILYSGDIIIKEAQLKGITLKLISLPAFSVEQFLHDRSVKDLSTIMLTTTKLEDQGSNSLNRKSFVSDKVLEYKSCTSTDNYTYLVRNMFLLHSLYQIPVDKFIFFTQNINLVNIIMQFNNGSNLINATSNRFLYSMMNHYFLERNELKKESAVEYIIKQLDLNMEIIDIKKAPLLKLGIEFLKKDGCMPILYYIANEYAMELSYENKFDLVNLEKILKKILNDKTLYTNHPDLDTIYALETKVKAIVDSYCK